MYCLIPFVSPDRIESHGINEPLQMGTDGIELDLL